ncbi:MAG TPA: hypothetical protein EYP34_05115, partial [Chromatiaceae bacterium]|nr:hypothetical protein [Chromatiaceae bacterium]
KARNRRASSSAHRQEDHISRVIFNGLLGLAERIDQHFPQPNSNRGFRPSEFIKTFILMQHEGSFHLDDIRHIQDDEALRSALNLNRLPKATTLGDWLRRMGSQPQIRDAWVKVNQALLLSALHRRKNVTLDIDATEMVAHKADAQWTYNKNRGFMPMVGHIAETGQVVAVDFRSGNVPPAQDNLALIHQCKQSLPEGCSLNALRIDAAGYQTKIIQYCDNEGIEYAIRAKASTAMRAQIEAARTPIAPVTALVMMRMPSPLSFRERPFEVRPVWVWGHRAVPTKSIRVVMFIERLPPTVTGLAIAKLFTGTTSEPRTAREPHQGTEAGFWR